MQHLFHGETDRVQRNQQISDLTEATLPSYRHCNKQIFCATKLYEKAKARTHWHLMPVTENGAFLSILSCINMFFFLIRQSLAVFFYLLSSLTEEVSVPSSDDRKDIEKFLSWHTPRSIATE